MPSYFFKVQFLIHMLKRLFDFPPAKSDEAANATNISEGKGKNCVDHCSFSNSPVDDLKWVAP